MNKTVTWVVVIVVIIIAIVLFVWSGQSNTQTIGDTNTADQSTSTTANQNNGTNADKSVGTNLDIDSKKVTFNIEGSNFKFAPNKIEVKKGATVEIVFKNTIGFHDFVIDPFNARTRQIKAGETDSVSFVVDKVGSFEFYCSVGTHKQMGMVGTLIVTE